MALALLYFLRSSLVRRTGGRQVTARLMVIASLSVRRMQGRQRERPRRKGTRAHTRQGEAVRPLLALSLNGYGTANALAALLGGPPTSSLPTPGHGGFAPTSLRQVGGCFNRPNPIKW